MKNKEMKKKLAFASADIFGGGSFNIINFLYPGFLALTVGLNLYLVGVVMLVVRIWDAVSDPLMGFISDRTKSRFGKRRIYLIIASPLVLVSMFLLFYPFGFSSVALRFIAVLLSYLIFATVQTMVMIPYFSLASEISGDYQKRADYNSVRLGFSIFSSIVSVAVPGIIVGLFGDEHLGYQVMSLTFGLIFAVSVLITGLFAREEIVTDTNSDALSLKRIVEPLKLKVFRQYLVMFLMMQISAVIMSGLFFFYVDFHVTKDLTADVTTNGTSMIGMIAAALMFLMQIVALPFYLKLIDKYSKTFAYRVGALIWILSVFLIFLIKPNSSAIILYVFAALIGFGISGPGLVPHTMFGDIADVGELYFGKRLDGQMSGFANFVNKLSQALGMFVAMTILGIAKFKEQEIGEPPVLSQPDSAILAMKLLLVLAPLILMGIGFIVSKRFKLDKAMHEKVRMAIDTNSNIEEILGTLQ